MVKYIKLGRFAVAYDDTRPTPRLNPDNPSPPPISEPSERKLFVVYVAKTIGFAGAVLFGFLALLMIISLANESSDTGAAETKVNGAADDSMDKSARKKAHPIVPMGSTVRGLRFVALPSIPLGSGGKLDTFCENYVVAPETAGGMLAQQRGWMVTGEQPLGPFEAVSFVANLEPGTSGACFPIGGNVALFKGYQLVGIVFADNEDEQPILKIIPTQDDRRVRIWSGMGMPPAADILVSRLGRKPPDFSRVLASAFDSVNSLYPRESETA